MSTSIFEHTGKDGVAHWYVKVPSKGMTGVMVRLDALDDTIKELQRVQKLGVSAG